MAFDFSLLGGPCRLAIQAGLDLMADGEWHPRSDVVSLMVEATIEDPIHPKTAANLVRELRRHGVVTTKKAERRYFDCLTFLGEKWRLPESTRSGKPQDPTHGLRGPRPHG